MLDLVKLSPLMAITEGCADVVIGVIDGPVNTSLPDFASSAFRHISSNTPQAGSCKQPRSRACNHGTLVASILTGRRVSTPAICPGCTLLLRPIFTESHHGSSGVPASDPEVLASAIVESVRAGAAIINLSCGVLRCSMSSGTSVRAALSFAAAKEVIVVAAAGNQATVGGSCITEHPWVVPVISIDGDGRPTNESNLSASIGRRGLAAVGQYVTALSATGESDRVSGTSIACPFVTGAAALLLSCFPHLGGSQIKQALTGALRPRTIVPPAMNAWEAYQILNGSRN